MGLPSVIVLGLLWVSSSASASPVFQPAPDGGSQGLQLLEPMTLAVIPTSAELSMTSFALSAPCASAVAISSTLALMSSCAAAVTYHRSSITCKPIAPRAPSLLTSRSGRSSAIASLLLSVLAFYTYNGTSST